MAGNGSTPGPAQPLGVQSTAKPSATDEQRREWREKKKRQREARKATSDTGEQVPASARAADSAPAQAGSPPPVPWTSDHFAGLFENVIIPAAEKLDVTSIVKKAKELGDAEVLAEVEKDAPWNPVAKATLGKTSPEVAARLLNRFGLSAENAVEAIWLGAVGTILGSRVLLTSKLDEMIKAKQQREAKAIADRSKAENTGATIQP